ncbi:MULTISPECIES: CobW family GTP-binding protein [Staphylococcus]|uniref:CobW family GTP-binding protein n=1 Tax=Staphylococcus TaxID=1279 RepID=UPI00069E88F6|nr:MULTISPECIES: GTP-binding protein [Staphylococcus]MEB6610730.1 GTP-binding protein [Staphylococcus borealis]MEB7366791.1 GTP-binding protein [Staphylococcus borealis]MEB7460269.1 GTP-binding protein [Staphylococcus borealis]MUN94879.1 GTP-binding protein [Staphylococcus borealis]NUI79352.1 GTP-binding protein [Staphylococcus borealis]
MEIIIVGGFLGSGKTTTLNHLITDALNHNLKTALIINEFGKMSVDSQLIHPAIPISEIVEGCICCAMKSDVSQQLHELYLAHQPDLVFIECSGVAEPLAVVDACLTPVLAPITTIRSMLGIIDANLYAQLETYPRDIQALFYEQLSHCSTLFVNKIDIADVEQIAHLLRHLEVINGEANIQVGQWGKLSLNTLLNVKHLDVKQSGTLHHAINHQLIEPPLSQTKAALIERLTKLPQQVYRVKGFVRFTDHELIHLVQYAEGEMELTPVQFKSDVPLYLVVIGKQLDDIELVL